MGGVKKEWERFHDLETDVIALVGATVAKRILLCNDLAKVRDGTNVVRINKDRYERILELDGLINKIIERWVEEYSNASEDRPEG